MLTSCFACCLRKSLLLDFSVLRLSVAFWTLCLHPVTTCTHDAVGKAKLSPSIQCWVRSTALDNCFHVTWNSSMLPQVCGVLYLYTQNLCLYFTIWKTLLGYGSQIRLVTFISITVCVVADEGSIFRLVNNLVLSKKKDISFFCAAHQLTSRKRYRDLDIF